MDTSIELEEEGQGALQMVFFVAFFIVLLGMVMGLNRVASRSIIISNAENVSEEVGNKKYLESHMVQVSAEVPNFLGTKEISSTPKEVAYMTFGNYEKGFLATDTETGEQIFSYKEMPGDGVVFRASSIYKNIYLTPNY